MDDGTPRFAAVTPEIVVAHSGLAADGRVLLAAAQRLAVEHEYTFGNGNEQHLDVAIFLEEMALLLQSYTRKPATRPFGASLVVAYLPMGDRPPALSAADLESEAVAIGGRLGDGGGRHEAG